MRDLFTGLAFVVLVISPCYFAWRADEEKTAKRQLKRQKILMEIADEIPDPAQSRLARLRWKRTR